MRGENIKRKKKTKQAEFDPVEAKVLGISEPPVQRQKKIIKVFGVKKEEVFTPKTLWKITTSQGSELVYTGFEAAQMMSVAAKEKICRGCRELEDNGYKFTFLKALL